MCGVVVMLVSAPLPGDHHGDESSAHPASGELKASMSELFYDLIFVVIMIRLAEIIKYNFGAEAVFEVRTKTGRSRSGYCRS